MNYHYMHWPRTATICQAKRAGTEFSIRASGMGNTDAEAQKSALIHLIYECQKTIDEAVEEFKALARAADYNEKENQ